MKKRKGRNVKESLVWLNDMNLFQNELKIYIATLPTHFNTESIECIPPELKTNPTYKNLCRVSKECEYMNEIPKEECHDELINVLKQSRGIFLDINNNPSLNVFRGLKKTEPFYEKALLAGMSLAVEHNIVTNINK
jgi:hypothetical protein